MAASGFHLPNNVFLKMINSLEQLFSYTFKIQDMEEPKFGYPDTILFYISLSVMQAVSFLFLAGYQTSFVNNYQQVC